MSADVVQGKSVPKADVNPQSDYYRRKLQRILRASAIDSPHLSGGVSSAEQRRMSEQRKAATLAPKLVNPTAVHEYESPLYQCTECDMIVKRSDPYCPFCGAIFADVPSQETKESEEAENGSEAIERPSKREPIIRPEKFDLFSLIEAKPLSKDMLYQEALKGFTGSARLLEEIERIISDVSSLGTNTSRARRLIGSAWEACRDGDWNLVSTLAHQTEEIISPSIPELVRSQMDRVRKLLTDAKSRGVDISPYILPVKSAAQALRANDPDEALRITKELTDRLREDSIAWK